MFNKAERIIALRNLRPKRKEGFLKVISIFSFLGIMLGVAVLIIVMSVMNGFRTDLTNKILGLNPHITAKPYQVTKGENFKLLLKKRYKDFKISESLTGEGVAINKENTKGVLIKGVNIKENNNIKFLQEKILAGDFKNFNSGKIILGNELALTLEVSVGDNISLMSSTFINTPIGKIPKQEIYKVSAIFNSGFYEFDQNIIFLNISDAMGFFEKTKEDLSLEIYLDKPIKADFYKKAAPRTPLESPCSAFISRVSTRSENTYSGNNSGTRVYR